jgi:hypothetical protein
MQDGSNQVVLLSPRESHISLAGGRQEGLVLALEAM